MGDSRRRCNWLELPREITALILQKAGPFNILMNAQFVCKYWHTISLEEPSLWTRISVVDLEPMPCYNDHNDYIQATKKIGPLIREAVDRSQGGLVDLNLDQFMTDDLLRFITQRCTKIRRLRGFVSIIDEKLCKPIATLHLLEELDMVFRYAAPRSLEYIGRNCPRLTSLKWNYTSRNTCSGPMFNNCDAEAIARTMPQLRRLQLIINGATIEGVRDILNACPNLKSLDLRGSVFAILGKDVREMCAGRINNLRGPFELYYVLRIPPYEPNDMYHLRHDVTEIRSWRKWIGWDIVGDEW